MKMNPMPSSGVTFMHVAVPRMYSSREYETWKALSWGESNRDENRTGKDWSQMNQLCEA
jgi:hypothetical protein